MEVISYELIYINRLNIFICSYIFIFKTIHLYVIIIHKSFIIKLKGVVDIYFACSVAGSKSHQNKYPPTHTKGKEIIKLLSSYLIIFFYL